MTVAAPTLASIADFSLTFPAMSDWHVNRENILQTIEQIFQREYDVLLLDGAGGAGKTIALAQFCQRNFDSSFSLFVRPASEIAYDPAYCRMELSNQIQWHLSGISASPDVYPDAAHYRTLLHQLSKEARRRRRIYYFVIDGLADIPASAQGARSLLVNQLPLGLPGFRFLFSGNLQKLPELADRTLRCREQDVAPFSLDETKSLFRGIVDDPHQVADLHRRFNTSPAKLASFRRIYSTSPTEVATPFDAVTGDVLQFEWDQHPIASEGVRWVVSAMAFFPSIHDLNTLAAIADREADALSAELQQLPYLVLDRNRRSVSFAAEGFRLIAKSRLAKLEREVLEKCIIAYGDRPIDSSSAQILPELLEKQGNNKDLFQFLSRDNLTSIFDATNSLGSLTRQLERAAGLADHSGDIQHSLQFALHRGAIKELLDSSIAVAQIEATQMVLGPNEAARLANAEVAVEDRLHALCEVAKQLKLRDNLDPTIHADIRNLCAQVDAQALGERCVEIASAIMYFDTSLALNLLKRSANTTDGANSMDHALTSISVKAYIESTDRLKAADAVKSILATSQTEKAERYSGLLGIFAAEQTAAIVLQDVQALSKTSDKISLLQQWIRKNYRHSDALDVGRAIIKVLLDDPLYVPNARVLRDATLPLAAISDVAFDVKDILAIVDSQSALLKSVGPVSDYYRTRFHLARVQTMGCNDHSLAAFDSESMDIVDEKDLFLKIGCLSWLSATLHSIDNLETYKDPLGLVAYATTALRASAAELLMKSAEHIEVMRPVIRALAGIDDELLFSLIDHVNTQERRDQCFRLIARFGRRNPYWKPSVLVARTAMTRCVGFIQDPRIGYLLTVEYLDWLSENPGLFSDATIDRASDYDTALLVADPVERVRILGSLISKGYWKNHPDLLAQSIEAIRDGISEAETPTRTRRACFVGASALAEIDPGVARELFFKGGGGHFRADHEGSIAMVAREVVRWYAGLARMRTSSESDWTRVKSVFEAIESPIIRCQFAANLALWLHSTDPDHAREVASFYVKPIVQSFQDRSQQRQPYVSQMIVAVAPALWIVHSAQAMQTISQLSSSYKEEARDNILNFILHGRLVDEPYTSSKDHSSNLSDERVADALSILAAVELDHVFYGHAKCILDSLTERTIRGRFSKNQAQEVRRQIRELGSKKLPARGGVPHDGYLILLEGAALAGERTSDAEWEHLVSRAQRLPNSADAAFVCAQLVGMIPTRNNSSRHSAFNAAAAIIGALPLMEDRVDRASLLFEEGWNLNGERCKAIAKSALESSVAVRRDTVKRRRLKLIESVHRFDEDLAASLASIGSAQDQSSENRTELAERVSTIELTQELSSSHFRDKVEKAEMASVSEAAYRALAKLNGGAATTASIGDLRSLLVRAGGASFGEAGAIHAFVCEALVRRYQGSREGAEYLRGLFELYSSSFFILHDLVGRLNERANRDVYETSEVMDANRLVVSPGDRGVALDWLGRWLARSLPKEILIVDPYFGPGDLRSLELIQRASPTCRVDVLTTLKGQKGVSAGGAKPIYEQHWKGISLGDPPDTRVIIVSSPGDLTAFLHDRWWLTEHAGIGLGTSFNSLGEKFGEIHELDSTTARNVRVEMDQFLQLSRRLSNGQKLSYETFTLD